MLWTHQACANYLHEWNSNPFLLKFGNIYRIRSSITTGLYFSKWVFGWGSIQKIPQKVDFLTKKWGSIQEKPQKQDFWKRWGCIQEWGCIRADTVFFPLEPKIISELSTFEKVIVKNKHDKFKYKAAWPK